MKQSVHDVLKAQSQQVTDVWTDELSRLWQLQKENPDQVRHGGGLAFVDPDIHRIRNNLIELGSRMIHDKRIQTIMERQAARKVHGTELRT